MTQGLERIAQFTAPDPLDLPEGLAKEELRTALLDARGPPDLASRIRDGLAARSQAMLSPFASTGGHMGLFEVSDGAGRVSVIVTWWPVERFWTVGVLPTRNRTRTRRSRERDTALTREMVTHVRQVLAQLDEVSDVRWMTDEQARATEL